MSDSSSFSLLHETVRRWIWNKQWESLRDIQERSIPHIINEKGDLIISASTASGKTEAAFLPIVSKIASSNDEGGFRAIYISPLKALINDQFRRIEDLCLEAEIPVTKWHGDVSASVKTRAKRNPGGILLITPESMEAMLCLRGNDIPRLFNGLEYIVIDELHAFMGNERGCQLRSIMHRMETITGITTRIGLSATLADMRMACSALRPGNPDGVTVLTSDDTLNGIALSVKGYNLDQANNIPKDIYKSLHGHKNLLFAGSRRNVEMLTVELNGIGENNGCRTEFFAHHGSLSKEIREEAERHMRSDGSASIVCTTTLELGIDVGDVECTAQYGAGFSVSGMRQRMGRSGRRDGKPSILRTYIREARMNGGLHVIDALRMETFRTVSMTKLMLEKWNEPSNVNRLDMSTVLQQVLALITEKGGITPSHAFSMLSKSNVFPNITVSMYQDLLTSMRGKELIEQSPDGTLLLGEIGEIIVKNYDFYAVFMTPEEYKIVEVSGRSIGTIPASGVMPPGTLLLLAGKRWSVVSANSDTKIIIVEKAYGGEPPIFGGSMPSPNARVVEEMRNLYLSKEVPEYLDKQAKKFLEEGRETFYKYNLDKQYFIEKEAEVILFPWVGGLELTAMKLALIHKGLPVEEETIALLVREDIPGGVKDALEQLVNDDVPSIIDLTSMIDDLKRSKYDEYLSIDILRQDWASEFLDCTNINVISEKLLRNM